jgi:hypothetical protein
LAIKPGKRKSVVVLKRVSKRIKKNLKDMQTSNGKTGESVYYESSESGSYGGVRALACHSGSPVKTVKRWLETQDPYTLHKPAI